MFKWARLLDRGAAVVRRGPSVQTPAWADKLRGISKYRENSRGGLHTAIKQCSALGCMSTAATHEASESSGYEPEPVELNNEASAESAISYASCFSKVEAESSGALPPPLATLAGKASRCSVFFLHCKFFVHVRNN